MNFDKNVLSSLDEDVKKALGEEVRKKIIASRVAKELDRLSKVIEDAMDFHNKLDTELKEIRGSEQFDSNGTKVMETFTKQQAKRKKELQEDLKVLDEALALALCESKYEKLAEFLSKHLDKSQDQ